MRLQPATIGELQEMVALGHSAIGVRGAGTKSPDAIGHERTIMELTRFNGVREHSPDECVFTALAGTPLRDINRRLAAHGQYLPFDPPFVDAGATIGGTVAAGLSGSGRYRYGGVRDFIIGATVVDGLGRRIRSGGKVVKNAAGFLLHYGMVGSRGRFGILTEVTFKVFPVPESHATLQAYCTSVPYAVDTVRAVEAKRFDVAALDFDDTGVMWIRVSGRPEAVYARTERLQRALPWTSGVLDAKDDERFWHESREFAWASAASIVKVPLSIDRVPDAQTAALTANARRVRYTSGGNCMWAATDDVPALDSALSSARLRGVVVRGPQAGMIIGVRATNAFEERVRSVLDPHHRFSAASDSDR